MRRTSLLSLGAGVLLMTACNSNILGALGGILGGAGAGGVGSQQQGQIQAEVQQVDVNNQRMNVRTQDGQSGWIRFDSQTIVVYRQQQYPITALERGDILNIQVQQTSQNELYATRIDVAQSVQERSGRP